MNDPESLAPDALKVALESAETLLTFRDFTPPGGLFVMVLGAFRDELREALCMEVLRPAVRGHHSRPLDELRSIELSTMAGAVMILRQPRFTRVMDDPELILRLEEMESELDARKRTLALLREEPARTADAP